MFKNMCRFFTFAVTVMVLTVCFAMSSAALTSGYYQYEVLSNGTVKLTGYTGTATSLTLPSKISSKTLTEIGTGAFKGNTKLQSVSIPSGVKTIEKDAFNGCKNLASISIPSTVSTLGEAAFASSAIKSISIPTAVKSIPKNAFNNCTKLTSVSLHSGISTLGEGAFNSTAIKSISIPSGVKSIPKNIFSNCTNLNTVTIPSSVTYIGETAFASSGLTSVTIPSSVTSVDYGAFKNCTALEKITLPETNLTIGRYAFYDTKYYNTTSNWKNSALYIGKHLIKLKESYSGVYTVTSGTITIGGGALSYVTKLTKVTIPDGVKKIGFQCFAYSSALSSVKIPSSVTSISSNVFLSCISLTSIEVPDSVTTISSGAFGACTSLKSVKLSSNIKSISSGLFAKCTALTEVVLPEAVTSIGASAFEECKALTELTIPGTVTKIASKAFNKCTKLKTINFLGSKTAWNDITTESSNDPLKTATVHYFTSFTTDAYVNCLQDRTKTAKCTDCSAQHVVVESGTAKNGHGTITYVPYKAATCTVKGNNAYYKCSGCTSLFSDSEAKNVMNPSNIVISSPGKHSTKTNVTKATLTANGSKISKCTVCGAVTSSVTLYYPKTISISATSYTYDGKAKTPTVTVKNSKGTTLKNNTDYTVSYSSGRTKVGRYTVTVKFKGDYSGSKSFKFAIYPKIVTSCTATQTTSSIKLTWGKASGATGYGVYKYDSKTKKYTLLKKVTGTSYTISKLSAGKKYAYSIRPYAVVNNETFAASYSKIFSTSTKPAKVTSFKISKKTSNAYTFTWKAVSGATGYRVYSYDAKTKKYTSLGSVTGKNTLTVKNVKKTASYQFAVRAYINNDLGTVWGDYSSKLIVVGTPSSFKGSSSSKKGNIKLSWSDVSGESGYEIYWSSDNKKFTLLDKNLIANQISQTYGPFPSGKTYYFRVRAYVKSGSKTYYGDYVSTSAKAK